MEPITTEIVVLGAGPGGYAAAFYAADKGKKVTLVEQNPRLGGICLNVGCIPSKALLHATEILRESKESAARGIEFGAPKIDLENCALGKLAFSTSSAKASRPSPSSARFRSSTAAATLRIRKRCGSKPAKDKNLSATKRRSSPSAPSRPCPTLSISAILGS